MAEGNLGNLVVSISADMTSLNKGLTEANKNVQETSAKIADLTKKIGSAMTIAGGAVTAAFGLMVRSAVQYGDQLYEVSQRTGIAVETLSKLKYVAEQTESSFEALSAGLRFMNRAMYESQNGSKDLEHTFRILGVNIKDSQGALRDTESVFLDLADSFQKIDDQAKKTALAMQIFGRGAVSLIPVLNLGSAGIKELSLEAEKLGLVLTTKNAAQIDKFSDDMKKMKEATGGLWLELSGHLIPILTDFVNRATGVLVRIREWAEAHPVLSDRIVKTTAAFGALLLILGTASLTIIKLVESVKALAVALGVATPLLNAISILQLGGLTTSVTTIASQFGWLSTMLPVVGAGLAGLTIGNLVGQIKQVQGFFDWIVGADKAKAFEAQATAANVEAVARKQEAFPTLGGGGSADLGTITISKSQAEMDSQFSLRQAYTDTGEVYRQVQEGMLAADASRQVAQITLERSHAEERQGFLQTYNQLWIQGHAGMWAFANQFIQSFSSGMSNALSSIILGTTKASEAFKQLGQSMIKMVVEYLAQQAVAWAISKALAMVAHTTASTMAASLAMSWAPAAFLASVATLGGAVGVGSAALATGMAGSMAMAATSVAASKAGGAAGFAEGTDTVPAMLSPGEMVIPRSFADSIRAGDLTLGGQKSSPTNQNTNIEINLTAVINNEMDLKRVAEQLAFETDRELRYVQ